MTSIMTININSKLMKFLLLATVSAYVKIVIVLNCHTQFSRNCIISVVILHSYVLNEWFSAMRRKIIQFIVKQIQTASDFSAYGEFIKLKLFRQQNIYYTIYH